MIGATGAIWSGGAGTYTPNNTTLNATYSPSAAERTAGTVTLTLTSAGNGNCTAVSDQVTYSITPAPTANAGADQALCSNNAIATLGGSISCGNGGGGERPLPGGTAWVSWRHSGGTSGEMWASITGWARVWIEDLDLAQPERFDLLKPLS